MSILRLMTMPLAVVLLSGCNDSQPGKSDPIVNIHSVPDAEALLSERERSEFSRLLVCEIDLAMKKDGSAPVVDGKFATALFRKIKSNIGAADICIAKLRE